MRLNCKPLSKEIIPWEFVCCFLLYFNLVYSVSIYSLPLQSALYFSLNGSLTLLFSLIKSTQCKPASNTLSRGQRSRSCASFAETRDLRTLHMRLQRERGACRHHSSTAVKVKTPCCCCCRCLFCSAVGPTASNLAYIL